MFSVIIPLYNKESTIKSTLTSVLSQTFSDFEIIIINDGSTDNSLLEVKKIKSKKIKIFHQENQGPSAARNLGVKKSQFEFLAFLDADDAWDKNYLKTLKELITSYSTAKIFACATVLEYAKTQIRNPKKKSVGLIENLFFYEARGEGFVHMSNFCTSRKTFSTYNGFNEKINLYEDRELIYQIALKSTIAFSPKSYAVYNKNYSSLSEVKNQRNKFLIHYLVDFLKKNIPLVAKEKLADYQKLLQREIILATMNALLLGDKKMASQLFFDSQLISFYDPIRKLALVVFFILPTSTVRKIYNWYSPSEHNPF